MRESEADLILSQCVDCGHGAVPLKGKIGEIWEKEGGLENKLGLPTAPEKGDAASGWTQSFQKGVLKWAKDESGKYGASTMDR
ncbi:hypothetical protein [Corynebacterium resistens]|uniref:hypothetical protein n=1 Tax=Corynebacterium resistens TaxID=258224 RepID=UPI002354DE9E|nr:hypothetical protein [Corynebacterium resistens]